jgi:Pyruvate/2-oxoacid:ferredoxin oxidoreductase delta subunit
MFAFIQVQVITLQRLASQRFSESHTSMTAKAKSAAAKAATTAEKAPAAAPAAKPKKQSPLSWTYGEQAPMNGGDTLSADSQPVTSTQPEEQAAVSASSTDALGPLQEVQAAVSDKLAGGEVQAAVSDKLAEPKDGEVESEGIRKIQKKPKPQATVPASMDNVDAGEDEPGCYRCMTCQIYKPLAQLLINKKHDDEAKRKYRCRDCSQFILKLGAISLKQPELVAEFKDFDQKARLKFMVLAKDCSAPP